MLLVGVVAAARARAQDPRRGEPETTLSETPAQSESDRKARALFEQGRAAYDEGRYRDAWDYFRQAYLLSKRPALLYNVGQAADRLRKDREALEAFRLYLARMPQAENRREVENRVRALEEQLGETSTVPPAGPASAAPDADPAYGVRDPEQKKSELAFLEGAGEGAASTGAPIDAAQAEKGAQPERKGWYARLGLGTGILGDSIGGSQLDRSLTSLTFVGHLTLGHDLLLDGLVIGGGFDFVWGLTPTVHVEDADYDVSTANLTLVLAFADYYLAPERHGWHLTGGLALAFFSLSETNAVIGSEDATGGGIVLGGGYDWPLAREWAVGALGRLILARADQDTGSHNLLAFSVLAAVNWF